MPSLRCDRRRRERLPAVIDTASVRADDRFEYWTDEVNRSFQPIVPRQLTTGTFRGRMSVLDLGVLRAHRVTGDAWGLHRTAASIRAHDPEIVQLALQVSGRSIIEQAGRRVILTPGQLTSFDTSRPYVAGHDVPFEVLLFCLPRDVLGGHVRQVVGRAAVALGTDAGPGQVLGPFLRSVVEGLESGALPESSVELGESVAATVRALYAGDPAPAAPGAVVLEQVKATVEAELGDPALDPAGIAARHAISVRQLHRLFDDEDLTVARYVKARRLERSRRDLRDPSLAGVPIADLATRWGFADPAGFSRAFRDAYGTTPRDYRSSGP